MTNTNTLELRAQHAQEILDEDYGDIVLKPDDKGLLWPICGEDEIGGPIEADDQYLLIEANVGGNSPYCWVTFHRTATDAANYHVNQEYASDWEISALWHLGNKHQLRGHIEVSAVWVYDDDDNDGDDVIVLSECEPFAYGGWTIKPPSWPLEDPLLSTQRVRITVRPNQTIRDGWLTWDVEVWQNGKWETLADEQGPIADERDARRFEDYWTEELRP